MTNPEIAFVVVLALLVGWVAHKTWLRFAPSEKALALKAGIKALDKLSALKSTAPEDIAAAAAAQAHEAALTQAFKDKAAKLS